MIHPELRPPSRRNPTPSIYHKCEAHSAIEGRFSEFGTDGTQWQIIPILYNETRYQIPRGETMASLTNALQQLRAERQVAQLHVEKLDQAISVIESLNGSGKFGKANRPTRTISAASRRKMALAQKARWAKARNGSQPAKTTAPAKRTLSIAARRKIAVAQRARWASVKAGQQKRAA